MKTRVLCLLAIVLNCYASWCDAQEPKNTSAVGPNLGTAETSGRALLSVEDFTKIASSPGDDTPLLSQLAKAGPHWANAAVSVAIKYQDGRVFNEKMASTSKTVNGKYIVTTAESQFYHQKMTAVSTFDEKASAYRTWGLIGNVVTEQTAVYDFDKKIYATSSSYGDGFIEAGVGSYSDAAESSKTLVYKNGVLFMTRDVRVIQIEPRSHIQNSPVTNDIIELDVLDFKPAYFLSGSPPPAQPFTFAYFTFATRADGDSCKQGTRMCVSSCVYTNKGLCKDGEQLTHIVFNRKARSGHAKENHDNGGTNYDASEIDPIYVPDTPFKFDHYYIRYRSNPDSCLVDSSMSVKAYSTNYSTNCTHNGITTSFRNIYVNDDDVISN
jgi:hypothetical protein